MGHPSYPSYLPHQQTYPVWIERIQDAREPDELDKTGRIHLADLYLLLDQSSKAGITLSTSCLVSDEITRTMK